MGNFLIGHAAETIDRLGYRDATFHSFRDFAAFARVEFEAIAYLAYIKAFRPLQFLPPSAGWRGAVVFVAALRGDLHPARQVVDAAIQGAASPSMPIAVFKACPPSKYSPCLES
jgi:hypothetical protein